MESKTVKIRDISVDNCIKCTPRHGGYKRIKEIIDSASVASTGIIFELIGVYREMETAKKVSRYTVHLEIITGDLNAQVLNGVAELTDALKAFPKCWCVYVHSMGYSDDEYTIPTVYINILIDNE